MSKKQFASLEQLQRYLTRADVVSSVFKNEKVRRILANEMSKAVHKVVYDNYTPERYKRRKDDGGLSDTRNMNFTKVEIKGDNIIILFENLTVGQTRYIPIYKQPIDSMHGQFITDTITDYSPDNWIDPNATDKQGRVVSDPRDFISETIKNIKANPKALMDAIKSSYKAIGFDVK